MAIAFRAALAGDSAAGSSLTQAVTLPTGWAAGDFCVAGGRVGNATGTFTTPAGWTVINAANYATGGYAYCFYYRVLQAGDANPTLTYSVSSTWCWGSIGVFSNTAGTLSFDAQGTEADTTAGTTFTPPAAAAAGSGEASIVIAVGRSSASVTVTSWTDTPASGWTLGADDVARTGVANNIRFAGAYYQLGVSGTVTPGSFSVVTTASSSIFFSSQQVLVSEAAAAGAAPQPLVVPQAAVMQAANW